MAAIHGAGRRSHAPPRLPESCRPDPWEVRHDSFQGASESGPPELQPAKRSRPLPYANRPQNQGSQN